MKFSAITTLIAAPLALAGTLQADLVARGAVGSETEVSVSQGQSSSSGQSLDISLPNGQSVTEVIVIWVNNGGNSATSTINSLQSFSSNAGSQATHTVVVGGSAGLVYTPNTIEAAIGDTVIFQFESANHTATQSAFTTPCDKLEGGFDSGFMPNVNNTVVPAPQMAMQVTVSTPIWFYCRQKGHCGKGMTFSINPTANKTQAMFEQMAIAQNGTGTAAAIVGGTPNTAATTLSTASVSAATEVSSGSSGSLDNNSGSTVTIATGTGTNVGGACNCACLCGTAAFPSSAVQGIGAFGGMSGAMPMAALES